MGPLESLRLPPHIAEALGEVAQLGVDAQPFALTEEEAALAAKGDQTAILAIAERQSRAFRNVFLETEEGRRVLAMISLWCHLPINLRDDVNTIYLKHGAAFVGDQILRTITRQSTTTPLSHALLTRSSYGTE
jgi:hypothetical protein